VVNCLGRGVGWGGGKIIAAMMGKTLTGLIVSYMYLLKPLLGK
jgi:hypothetical protein